MTDNTSKNVGNGSTPKMNDTALSPIMTTEGISLTPEMFEKLYFSPHTQVKGDLRKTFGNPTPVFVPSRVNIFGLSNLYIAPSLV